MPNLECQNWCQDAFDQAHEITIANYHSLEWILAAWILAIVVVLLVWYICSQRLKNRIKELENENRELKREQFD